MFLRVRLGREYRSRLRFGDRTESNLRHLESVMQDVKDGKAHFAAHDLFQCRGLMEELLGEDRVEQLSKFGRHRTKRR